MNFILLDDLVEILQDINAKFGKGKIAAISVDMNESTPGDWHGTVIVEGGDSRMWKSDGRTVVFLSRRRTL